MKSLFILVLIAFAASSFANTLTPISFDQEQVNVTSIEATESFRSKDETIAGRVTTVYRGSAIGFSSVFVTFADSLEDPSYTFEFTYIIGEPKNISISKNDDGTYSFTMEVTKVKVEEDGSKFTYYSETITLKVEKADGEYTVQQ